jgi:NAD(P)-dependent dehydrogenase (short-subunit alcohol dehydrogenase family)
VSESLKGQVAIISGGIGDIGRAIASELARRGADVALGDLAPESSAQDFLQSLSALGVRSRYDVVDVTDADRVAAWVNHVEQDLGVATLIIPNAAIATVGGIREMTPRQFTKELRVNLDGAFFMAQAAGLRLLHHNKPGRIVFIGSWAAHAAHPQIPAYCASKAALRQLCRCLALELAPAGILVNEVAPGYVDAGLTGRGFVKNPAARERAAGRVPTGQLITAEEVALEVAHLCEPTTRHIVGSVILMDGGLSLVTPAAPQKK